MTRRHCFLLRVRPDRMDEYRRRHEQVWPEMLQALADTEILHLEDQLAQAQ